MPGFLTATRSESTTSDPVLGTESGFLAFRSEAALWVVTDLDGTLLDERYELEPARPALSALSRTGAMLVLASSKTRAEMEPLASRLGLRPALIVENGGATLMPAEGGAYEVIAAGAPLSRLRRALDEIGAETGAALLGFSALGAAEVARLTGLALDAARLALHRDYGEPFLLADEERLPAVAAAAERRGLRVSRGGRFFHLGGPFDKGLALRHLLARHGPPALTVGLGDAPNDLSMLRVVDRPILVPRPGGGLDAQLAAALPGAEVAPAPGPLGWNAAVLTLLSGGRLATVPNHGGSPVR